MSFTNQTEHYGLPQWLGTDTPDWASDVNDAFTEIDTQMYLNAKQEEGNTSLIGALGTKVESLSGRVSDALEHITEDNALLKEIEAQHKINTQHIADLQEDLQEETAAREAADTRLEGLIGATNNALEEVNQQVAGFQSGMEAAEAKIAQNKTDITALELKDGQHDTAITRAQETADTAQQKANENSGNITTLQNEVSENMEDIATLQESKTSILNSISKLKDINFTGFSSAMLVSYSGQQFGFAVTALGDLEPGLYVLGLDPVNDNTTDLAVPDIQFQPHNSALIFSAVRVRGQYSVLLTVITTIRQNEKLLDGMLKDNGGFVDTTNGRITALLKLTLK